MPRRPLLEFEKPLVELEQQIEQIRQLARDSEVDVSQQLQQLEAAAGRQRFIVNGPRSLDLDLLWCGDEQRSSAFLELPHPRLAQRRFVLQPLAALDPALVPPGQVLTVATLLARVEQRGEEPPPEQLRSPHSWPG